jgi:hypothetical protein
MAYNNLSGTVAQPNQMIPRRDNSGSIIVPILSGNLSTSDASSVINVPRVSNPVNYGMVTNIAGDANRLACHSEITFDGETLTVDGEISASVAVSASYYIGDGSRLVNVKADNVVAEGPIHSIQFHDSVDGDLTGSSNLLFSSSVLVVGAGLSHKRTRVTGTYSIVTTDYYVGIDTSANENSITASLPSANLLHDGQTYILKDEGGEANSKNVLISASAGNTIDGSNTVILESPYASIQLYCDGSNKFYVC